MDTDSTHGSSRSMILLQPNLTQNRAMQPGFIPEEFRKFCRHKAAATTAPADYGEAGDLAA